jgi:hypothetical protein
LGLKLLGRTKIEESSIKRPFSGLNFFDGQGGRNLGFNAIVNVLGKPSGKAFVDLE